MRIEATGKKNGKKLTVTVEDDKFLFNGKEDSFLKRILDTDLRMGYVFSGTYVPEEPEDELNIYNVLQNYFFDSLESIKADGLKPMESEENRIY